MYLILKRPKTNKRNFPLSNSVISSVSLSSNPEWEIKVLAEQVIIQYNVSGNNYKFLFTAMVQNACNEHTESDNESNGSERGRDLVTLDWHQNSTHKNQKDDASWFYKWCDLIVISHKIS